jgi:hypothetical protein
VAFAAFAYMHRAWEEVINILLGIGLIASPWILRFAQRGRGGGGAISGQLFAKTTEVVVNNSFEIHVPLAKA